MIKSIIVIILIITVFSCNSTKNNDIEIGVIVFKTGGASSYGEKVLNGLNLALNEINSKNSLKIKLIIEDDQTKPEKAVSAINKLLATNPDIQVVIAALTSSSTLAIAPIAEKNKIILFSPCSSSPDITNSGDYVFRNWPSDDVEGKLMAEYAISKGYKKIGILAINNAYGQGLKNVFKKYFMLAGGHIIIENSFNENRIDFKTLATKYSNKEVDAIYAPSYAKEAGLFIKAMRENGYSKPILGCVTYESQDLFITDRNELNNVVFTTPWFDITNDNNVVKSFSTKYKSKYNSIPDNFSAQSYDALKIIYKAITTVGNDAGAIKNYLYNLKNYNGVSGITSFDSNGDVIKPALIKEVKNGKFIILDEIK